jgi:hypothetical protein
MNRSPSREQGITFLGFVILMGLIGFFAMLIIKIGPIYLDHYKVLASLESLKSDPDFATRSKQEIVRSLEKHWEIDMIDSVTKDNVYVTKNVQAMTVQIVYDVVKPIAGNLDVLIHFDDSIEVDTN